MSKPIQKLRSGKVSCAVWQNDNGNKSLTFQYSYKDKQEQWQNTEFIPEYALPNLNAIINALTVKAVLTPANPKPSATYQQEPKIPSASNPTRSAVNTKPVSDLESEDQELPF